MKNNFKKLIALFIIINILLLYSTSIIYSKENRIKEENKKLNNRILKLEKDINIDEELLVYLNDRELKEDIRKSLKEIDIDEYSLDYLDMRERKNIIESILGLEIEIKFSEIENLIAKLESLDKVHIESTEIIFVEDDNFIIKIILKSFSDFDNFFRSEEGLVNKYPFRNKVSKEKSKLIIENTIIEDEEAEEDKESLKKLEKIEIDRNNKDIPKIEFGISIKDKDKISLEEKTEKKVIEKIVMEKENFFNLYQIKDKMLLGFINENLVKDKEYKLLELDKEEIIEKDISEILTYKLYTDLDNFLIETDIIYILDGNIEEESHREEFIRKNGILNNHYLLDLSSFNDIEKIRIKLILKEGLYKKYIILEELDLGEEK